MKEVPQPGRYPLGSLESRAAARAKIESEPGYVIYVHFIGSKRPSGAPRRVKCPGSNTCIEYTYADDQPKTTGEKSKND
jgi:hypothetical protein